VKTNPIPRFIAIIILITITCTGIYGQERSNLKWFPSELSGFHAGSLIEFNRKGVIAEVMPKEWINKRSCEGIIIAEPNPIASKVEYFEKDTESDTKLGGLLGTVGIKGSAFVKRRKTARLIIEKGYNEDLADGITLFESLEKVPCRRLSSKIRDLRRASRKLQYITSTVAYQEATLEVTYDNETAAELGLDERIGALNSNFAEYKEGTLTVKYQNKDGINAKYATILYERNDIIEEIEAIIKEKEQRGECECECTEPPITSGKVLHLDFDGIIDNSVRRTGLQPEAEEIRTLEFGQEDRCGGYTALKVKKTGNAGIIFRANQNAAFQQIFKNSFTFNVNSGIS